MSSFRHPSRLFDPFNSESALLPDLPVQLWYKEPSSLCEPEAPCVQGHPHTDDGFAWDWFHDRAGRYVFFYEGGSVSMTLYRIG